MTRAAFLVAFVLAIVITPADAAAEEDHRLRLRSQVEVLQETISLADLLPPDTPAGVHDSAAGILLGRAPLAGSFRVLDRGQIEHLLRGDSKWTSVLTIPGRVTITRAFRLVSMREVHKAIVQSLTGCGIPDNEMPRESDLEIAGPVSVTVENAPLQVLNIESDAATQETRFRIRPSHQPSTLGFHVMMRRALKVPRLVMGRHMQAGEVVTAADFKWEERAAFMDLPCRAPVDVNFAGLITKRSFEAGTVVTAEMFGLPVEVRPGRLATMMIQGPGFNAFVRVMPLQTGVRGQVIHVQNLDTKRPLQAEVMARDYVKQASVEGTQQ